MKIVWIMAVLAMVFVATAAFAQTKTKMETNKIEAKALYDACPSSPVRWLSLGAPLGQRGMTTGSPLCAKAMPDTTIKAHISEIIFFIFNKFCQILYSV